MRPNSGHSLSDVLKFPTIGITEDFSRLHCRPEIFANCFKMFTHSQILRIPLDEDTGIISKGFRPGFFLGISNSHFVLEVIDFN